MLRRCWPGIPINEFLQLFIEEGLCGLLLAGGILVFMIRSSKKNLEKDSPDNFPVIAGAIVLSALIFSLFSYPAQILPIKVCLTCGLAIFVNAPDRGHPMSSFRILTPEMKMVLFSGGMVLLCWLTAQAFRLEKAYQQWEKSHELYAYRMYKASLTDFKEAYPVLKYNGDFLTQYGKALALAGKTEEAAEVLRQSVRYYPNSVLYSSLGDCYKKMGLKREAEQAYLQAWYINPGRFYPKYLLTKLYQETGQREKAVQTARELMVKKVKIKSGAVKEMKREIARILLKETLQKSNPDLR